MAKTKITGYMGILNRNGIDCFVIVKAKSKTQAVKLFEDMNMPIIHKEHIHRVCAVKYPGPDSVKSLAEFDISKCEIIED